MTSAILESASKLPVKERLELLDQLWQGVARELEILPISAQLLAELDRRDAAYNVDPSGAVTLEELERSLFPKA